MRHLQHLRLFSQLHMIGWQLFAMRVKGCLKEINLEWCGRQGILRNGIDYAAPTDSFCGVFI